MNKIIYLQPGLRNELKLWLRLALNVTKRLNLPPKTEKNKGEG
jgi:hypothetical protein